MSPGKRAENRGLGSDVNRSRLPQIQGFQPSNSSQSSVWVSDTLLGSFYGLVGNSLKWDFWFGTISFKVKKFVGGINCLFANRFEMRVFDKKAPDMQQRRDTVISFLNSYEGPWIDWNLKDFCWEHPHLMDKILSQLRWRGLSHCSFWLQTIQKWMWKSWFSCVFFAQLQHRWQVWHSWHRKNPSIAVELLEAHI